jgi:excinuclease ABC subunit A
MSRRLAPSPPHTNGNVSSHDRPAARDAVAPFAGPRGISIRGAREHNLQNVTLTLPRNRLVVITGVSGSGKSSLAFDTLYAEGQRRYVESLSAYARQFLGQMEKPDVDQIDGLSPAISIEQRTAGRNPRSTVATITEIYDYLRLLFSRIGVQHCHTCGRPVSKQTVQEMVDRLLALPAGTRIQILAPLVVGRKGEYRKELEAARRQGYLRARIDGVVRDLEDTIKLEKNKKHTIEVVVDRLSVDGSQARRLADSLETAVRQGDGIVRVALPAGDDLVFSEKHACVECGTAFEELVPRMFSFNSPYGACPTCGGLGVRLEIEEARVVPDATKSIADGAIVPWGKGDGAWVGTQIKALAKELKFSLTTPWSQLPVKARRVLLHGSGEAEYTFDYKGEKSRWQYRGSFEGLIPNLMRRYQSTSSEGIRGWIESFMGLHPCPACGGRRLKAESLAVKIGSLSIADLTQLSVKGARRAVAEFHLAPREQAIAGQILKEITARLTFLSDVGLDYLTLDRSAATLAGGEAQRIRLATQIGSGLTGVLYILDEPSIGLHHRDNLRLLRTLLALRDLGNTVIVVEHDRDTMLAADYLVDLGPGAGRHGGAVVAAGTPDEVRRVPESLTGRFLAGTADIPVPQVRRTGNGQALTLRGARENNLKDITVRIPLGKLVCVTGVSGSGKSTLVNDILYRALARRLHNAQDPPGEHGEIAGVEQIDKVVDIDQSPIGRTPRSNAATYTGVFTFIRSLFAQVPEARVRGYGPGRFSFNVKGGRCEACEGDGTVKIEMHFLPDVYVSCDVCRGRRYNRETLEVLYKGKSIADVLEMTVEEACAFFASIPPVRRKLETLRDVGLGYLHLGQSATTLSGGEAQRVKLATELSRVATGRTLYILDEPTTGLHFEDVRLLLGVLSRLVDMGNTVLVIEHNLDVIKTADHIIDLGPEGGDEGGRVVATGTPEEVRATAGSYTGDALAEVLNGANGGPAPPARELARTHGAPQIT